MADLRLIALLLAGCGAADAQPAKTSGLRVPAGWHAMPAAATAARVAAGASGVVVTGAEAWGDPTNGCYAVWIALQGSGGTDRVAESLAAEHIVATPTGSSGFAIEKPPYKGRLEVRAGDGELTALACVGNQRDPVACSAACAGLLGGVR
jgi:hypothetical protein